MDKVKLISLIKPESKSAEYMLSLIKKHKTCINDKRVLAAGIMESEKLAFSEAFALAEASVEWLQEKSEEFRRLSKRSVEIAIGRERLKEFCSEELIEVMGDVQQTLWKNGKLFGIYKPETEYLIFECSEDILLQIKTVNKILGES